MIARTLIFASLSLAACGQRLPDASATLDHAPLAPERALVLECQEAARLAPARLEADVALTAQGSASVYETRLYERRAAGRTLVAVLSDCRGSVDERTLACRDDLASPRRPGFAQTFALSPDGGAVRAAVALIRDFGSRTAVLSCRRPA